MTNGQFTQKKDIMMTPEEYRVWQQKKIDGRRVMGGF